VLAGGAIADMGAIRKVQAEALDGIDYSVKAYCRISIPAPVLATAADARDEP